MKRIIPALLALVMLFSMAACAADNAPNNDAGNTETSGSTTETTAPNEIRFDELVVVDNDLCTVKITGIEEDNLWGYTLKVFLENKSADKNFMFSLTSAAVNGVQTDPLFATEVAAGKKATDEISFMDSDLKDIIDRFTDIELNFRIYDSDDWSADPVATPSVHVYPYGEEHATTYQRESLATDNILVDNEYAKIIVTGYEIDPVWGYSANLYIENKADVSIMVSADNVSVNGFMADPFFATSVSSGKCAFSSISWSEEIFEKNGIETVENIEFTLRVSNENDWLADDFVNTVITLNP